MAFRIEAKTKRGTTATARFDSFYELHEYGIPQWTERLEAGEFHDDEFVVAKIED